MEKKRYRFTLHERKHGDFWRGAVSGAMWAFGRTLPDGESFRWWWVADGSGQESWACELECSAEQFEKIKEYIDNTIPGTVFNRYMTD